MAYNVPMQEDHLDRWITNESESRDGLERRHWLRTLCSWPVELFPGLRGTVVDISPRGCQIQIAGKLSSAPGTALELKTLRPVRPPLQATVRAVLRWSQREGGANWLGCSFVNDRTLEQSWVQALLTKVFQRHPEQKRTNLRIPCHIPASLSSLEGGLTVTVLDLSLGGAMLECGQPLSPGSSVALCLGPWAPLPGLEIPGKVQRIFKSGGVFRFGLRFERRQSGETIVGYLHQAYELARQERVGLHPLPLEKKSGSVD